jgi:hypothetical protein
MADLASRETAELLTELEHRTRAAWTAYQDELEGLGGREYDDAERDAWAGLQALLRDIEADRGALADLEAEQPAAT